MLLFVAFATASERLGADVAVAVADVAPDDCDAIPEGPPPPHAATPAPKTPAISS
jgi:hypothetical protein